MRTKSYVVMYDGTSWQFQDRFHLSLKLNAKKPFVKSLLFMNADKNI